ncbi:replication restart helicase PriA [Aureispira anguillae]|uniref:Replication restart protein PriA n=1 Tax=Aureispira anguillae TaxID=2864201 RepID=A0A915YKV6_9BACT|nr:primosomal protein N' [Aureispira anguillae]BDS15073.1 primosomal protein N' [Aureispira anguillae]
MDQLLHLLENDNQATTQRLFVTVIVPVALPKLYTYSVPLHLKDLVQVGYRVEVQFGKSKLYSALIYQIHQNEPDNYVPKPILNVLDTEAVVTPKQFKLWEWMSQYYASTMGEVMNAALPAGLKLASETKIVLRPDFEEEDFATNTLNDKEYTILEALFNRVELSIAEIQALINQKTIYPYIKSLMEKRLIFVKEELKNKYKSKKVDMVCLAEPYQSDSTKLKDAFEIIGNKAIRQAETLMAYIQLSKEMEEVPKTALYDRARISSAGLKKLLEKNILEIYKKEISRLSEYNGEVIGNYKLSNAQEQARVEIKEAFEEKNVVLLHGVTGSGKTQVFVELMEETIAQGKQVLYLLPEIALTAQIVQRLQKHFGDQIIVYHSKFNNNERVEIWQNSLHGTPIILGARSALFLPFSDLGLIIVDEEHDPSYKQNDPSPRYNARDTAVFLSYLYQAKTLLGTATPSLETYYNVQQNKYGLVELNKRFGAATLPDISIVDAGEETKKKRMKSHFTPQLLKAIEETLGNGEQVILFQNRRGYAPVYSCNTCGWTADCVDCDVSLTYHKFSNDLHCHYCNHHRKLPKSCPACGNHSLVIKGFGTEKIEDELQIYLPDVKVARMDWDTVKGKHGHEKIIATFANKQVDILVGTQMVTKGLDFDNVGLVGVLSADQMLHFPDFRATERAFQLLLQVSGRAGRKQKKGRVLIQAYKMDHPVLQEVQKGNFQNFFQRELKERSDFGYPPFHRLIKVQLKHKKPDMVEKAAKFFAECLRTKLGDRILGPATPGISRIRTYYIRDIIIKLGKNSKQLDYTKQLINDVQNHLKAQKGFSTIRLIVDVDPY